MTGWKSISDSTCTALQGLPDYWTVYWDISRNVKIRFDAEGLSIPYTQQDLPIYQQQKRIAPPVENAEQTHIDHSADQMGLEQAD